MSNLGFPEAMRALSNYLRTLTRISDGAAKKIEQEFLRLRGEYDWVRIESAIKLRDFRMLELELGEGKIIEATHLIAKMREAMRSAGDIVGTAARMHQAFELAMPRAEAWLAAHGGKLVVEINDQTRAVLRTILHQAFIQQYTPREAAELMRGTIGLNSRLARAVARYKQRTDGLIATGKLDAARGAKRVARYAEKLLRYRTMMIARHQLVWAANAGQQAVWEEALREGLLTIRETAVYRQWITTPDDRTCKTCLAMGGQLAEVTAPWLVPTSHGDVNVMVPQELHPHCRCTFGLIYEKRVAPKPAPKPRRLAGWSRSGLTRVSASIRWRSGTTLTRWRRGCESWLARLAPGSSPSASRRRSQPAMTKRCTEEAGMAIEVQSKSVARARELVEAGKVDADSAWGFSAEDGNEILGDPPDWEAYAAWFLARDAEADAESKAAYKYPYGKSGKVYRSGVIAAKQRAAQHGEEAVAEAADGILQAIDGEKASPDIAQSRQDSPGSADGGRDACSYGETAADDPGAIQRGLAAAEWARLGCPGATKVNLGVGAVQAEPAGDPRNGGRVRFRITDAAADRGKDVIALDGWRLDSYRANPVVLWSHDYEVPPIARTVEITRGEDSLVAVAEFPAVEVSEFGNHIYRLIRAGFLGAASVGFMPVRFAKNEERGGVDFLEQELLEWSVVPVPANPRALMQEQAPLGAVRKWASGASPEALAALSAEERDALTVLAEEPDEEPESEEEPEEPSALKRAVAALEALVARLEAAVGLMEESQGAETTKGVTSEEAETEIDLEALDAGIDSEQDSSEDIDAELGLDDSAPR